MDLASRARLRDYIGQRLSLRQDSAGFADGDSLFVSGRLDSLDAIETIIFLESAFGVDFTATGFDLGLIDSIEAMAALAAA
jgi:acyl carrier protein